MILLGKELLRKMIEIIKGLIQENGFLDLYTYINLCQLHPEYGYYSCKKGADILGNKGDFITSPEISFIFSEIIAFWLIHQWEKAGKPRDIHLIELGPGSGKLMEGILKTLKKNPSFYAVCKIYFVEINSTFRQLQKEKISVLGEVCHYPNLDFLTEIKQPIFLIANEFFDALPVHQYMEKEGSWYEVGVELDSQNKLRYAYAPCENMPESVEFQPDTVEIIECILDHIKHWGGAALIIDYGYWEGQGDTVQAIYKHRYVGIFDYPGEADISVHVNFKNMALQCNKKGVQYNIQTQRQFLLDFGIQLRLEQICSQVDSAQASLIRQSVDRLINPSEMGHLFKVLHIEKLNDILIKNNSCDQSAFVLTTINKVEIVQNCNAF